MIVRLCYTNASAEALIMCISDQIRKALKRDELLLMEFERLITLDEIIKNLFHVDPLQNENNGTHITVTTDTLQEIAMLTREDKTTW